MKRIITDQMSFVAADNVAQALVDLDRAARESGTAVSLQVIVPGQTREPLWVHNRLGGREPIEVFDADEEVVAPVSVVVSPGTMRYKPIGVSSVLSEQVDIYDYDWL